MSLVLLWIIACRVIAIFGATLWIFCNKVYTANHQYTDIFLHAHEVLRQQPDTEEAAVRLRVAPGVHSRRGNLPTADEVAVILPGDQSQMQARDIILRKRDGLLLRISNLHPAYTPLYYVLLFPHGENGWHPDLRQEGQEGDDDNPRRLTQTRYVAYRLQVRQNEFSTILRGGRLFQRYLVDMWASEDQNRLQFLRMNQGTLRASLYSGLEDALHAVYVKRESNEQ
jgi:hypothetical protein